MKRVKNWLNAETFEKDYETNTKPSKTVPDQTMSIKEILDRHSRGLPISGQKAVIYHGEEEEYPDFRTLDLAEIQELKEQNAERIQQTQKQLREKPKPKNTPPAPSNPQSNDEKPKPGQDPAAPAPIS